MTMMTYRGYFGSTEIDVEEDILYGKLLYIRDLVNYEAKTPIELRRAFHDSVDDYISDCQREGVEPDVPFKGSFNVRINPALHRELAASARREQKTLNEYVGQVLSRHHDFSRSTRVAPFLRSHFYISNASHSEQRTISTHAFSASRRAFSQITYPEKGASAPKAAILASLQGRQNGQH